MSDERPAEAVAGVGRAEGGEGVTKKAMSQTNREAKRTAATVLLERAVFEIGEAGGSGGARTTSFFGVDRYKVARHLAVLATEQLRLSEEG